jgi:CspA family cold shock protein
VAATLEPRHNHEMRTSGEFVMRQSGTVKFYNAQKGFGFIKPDDGGKDVFVHVTAVEQAGIGNLDEGMRLSFETEPDKSGKGPKAVNLQASA